MSKIEETVAKMILERSKVGKNKYGTTMEREDLSLIEWLQHLQEELADACVYVEKIKQEIHYTDLIDPEMEVYGAERISPCSAHDKQMTIDEEISERRMNIIGQNGNDGLHYEDRSTYLHDKIHWKNKDVIQKRQQMYSQNSTLYPGDIDIKYTHPPHNED